MYRSMALSCLLACAGCGELLGEYHVAEEQSSEAGTADAGYTLPGIGWRYAAQACGQCTERQCVTEISACHADPTCDAYALCVARCSPGDAACGTNCERAVQGTFFSSHVFDLIHCGTSSCLEECGAVVADCGGIPAPNDLALLCCDELSACMADPECRRVWPCWVQCGSELDPGQLRCLTDCGGPGTAENVLQQAFQSCASQCTGSCQGVGDDSCLESVVVPNASTEDQQIYFKVVDFGFNDGLSGLLVEECSRVEPTCDPPLFAQTTDPDGYVVLPIHRDATGEPSVFFRITGAGRRETLYYPPRYWQNHSITVSIPSVSDPNENFDPPAPGHGHVAFAVRACSYVNEAGVQVTVTPPDPAIQTRYFRGSVPSSAATSTDAVSGYGYLVNVPAGRVTVQAIREATGVRIGTADVSVRDGAVTYVLITPS